MTANAYLRPGASTWLMYLECDGCGKQTYREAGPRKFDAYTLRMIADRVTDLGWKVKDDFGVSCWCQDCPPEIYREAQ